MKIKELDPYKLLKVGQIYSITKIVLKINEIVKEVNKLKELTEEGK